MHRLGTNLLFQPATAGNINSALTNDVGLPFAVRYQLASEALHAVNSALMGFAGPDGLPLNVGAGGGASFICDRTLVYRFAHPC